MERQTPSSILVEDVSAQHASAAMALTAPELEDLGFRRLGVVRLERTDLPAAPGTTSLTTVYVARYGDAVGFRDTLDPLVRTRLVSVLASGTVIETRLPTWVRPEPSAPEAPAFTLEPTPSGTRNLGDSLEQTVDRLSKAQLPWLDRFFDQLDASRLRVAYPARPAAGLLRQVVEMDDAHTLWVTHRGFVRSAVTETDDVVDHGRMPLVMAALRRSWHIHTALDLPMYRTAARWADLGRNLLLALPAALAIVGGTTWWIAGLLVGFTSSTGVAIRQVLRVPPLRVWIVLALPAIAVAGWYTIGWLTVAALVIYAFGIAITRDVLMLSQAMAFALSRQQDAATPPTLAVDTMLEAYR